jgi:hypothetical protein
MESSFRKQHSGFKRHGMKVKEASALHKIEWNRVVVRSEVDQFSGIFVLILL